ncbi:FAD-dependent oxidoreductase domain-containing protein 1 isoform X2 [Ceratitis capitata]|uniref:FAD-dependent oxidoreductase domain-containing protein 1 isoform X2 n=1 Tax=Ceratitis capitata TaxID=7213 RepID=UPI000329DE6E|nr:FAD-dependent oxidoreductase domain-containing protein 1 isoform X2 [Ceratitis capitata]
MIKSTAISYTLKMNKLYRPGFIRCFSDDNTNHPHPIKRTLKLLRNDMKKVKQFFTPTSENNIDIKREKDHDSTSLDSSEFQTHCDVLIIGGGSIGSSAAYWLKKKARQGLNIVVIERNSPISNGRAFSTMPVGGLRQQFFLPENIEMSLYGAEFMRNSKDELGVDINFDPQGFLTLASEENAELLNKMSKLQNEFGARTEILTAERLKLKYPWLNVEDVAIGCQGLEKHGWFDADMLVLGLRNKAKEYGVHFIKSELVGFEFQNQPDVIMEGATTETPYSALDKAVVEMSDGETRTIKFAICVLATGSNSEQIARMANIGTGPGILQVPLPIARRENFSYTFKSDDINMPGLGTPCVADWNGMYFRRDGLTGNYIAGFGTNMKSNKELKERIFENTILPNLTRRLNVLQNATVTESLEASYEYNVYDENGIIGTHPYYNNLYIATGFSGLGLQQSPAVGRAISEIIIDGQFRTIDLTRIGFDRLIVDRPMYEYSFM